MARKPNRRPLQYKYSDGNLFPITGKNGNITEEEKRSRVQPQAMNIIDKFGSAAELCRAIKFSNPEKYHLNESSVYRWMYARDKGGTGGEIPSSNMRAVLRAARYSGIILTVDDLYPDLFKEY